MPEHRSNLLFGALVLFLFAVVRLFSTPSEETARHEQNGYHPVVVLSSSPGVASEDVSGGDLTSRPENAFFSTSTTSSADSVSANTDSENTANQMPFEGIYADHEATLGSEGRAQSENQPLFDDREETAPNEASLGAGFLGDPLTSSDAHKQATHILDVGAEHHQRRQHHAHVPSAESGVLPDHEATVRLASTVGHLHHDRNTVAAASAVEPHVQTPAVHAGPASLPDRAHGVSAPHVATSHPSNPHPSAAHSHTAHSPVPHHSGEQASPPHASAHVPSIRDIPRDCKALLGPALHFTLKGMPESLLPRRPFDMFQNKDDHDVTYKSSYDFRSCAVVGNGGTLLKTRFGPAIDSHGAVFRQNQGPTHGYAPHTGQKTTFRLLNKLWLNKYSSPRKPSWLPLEQGVTLVASRGDTGLMRRLHAKFARSRQVSVVTMNGKAGAAARHLMEQFKHRRHCAGKGNKFDGGNTPSTGLFSVTVALILCDEVTVYGFGKGHGAGPYQYYTLHGTERRKGNPVHSFTAEKALVEALHESGHLTLCDDGSPRDCGMQARVPHRAAGARAGATAAVS